MLRPHSSRRRCRALVNCTQTVTRTTRPFHPLTLLIPSEKCISAPITLTLRVRHVVGCNPLVVNVSCSFSASLFDIGTSLFGQGRFKDAIEHLKVIIDSKLCVRCSFCTKLVLLAASTRDPVASPRKHGEVRRWHRPPSRRHPVFSVNLFPVHAAWNCCE